MVFWVFGYSSLVWNPGFEYDERIIGFIKNYRRAFHLACIDHRGTPEFPARAATLEAEEGAVCWGAALCVKDDETAKKVLAYLHVRECEYDVSASIDFFTEESPNMPVLSGILVFITTPDKVNNKYYLGPAPLEDMANQIARASGPCGPNYEYLFKMEAALKQIGHEDEELIKLADAVRTIMGNLNGDFNANCDTINLCLRIDQNETPINSSKQILFDKNSQSLSKPTLINNFIDSQLNGLNHVSLSNLGHMPHSPKLLKGQAL